MFWLTSIVFTYLADSGLKNQNTISLIEDWNAIIKQKHDSEIIILGSSRAKKHFNPSIIYEITDKSCYNLGIDGSKTMMQYAKWMTYTKYNKFPRYVIFNIEPGTFGIDSILFDKEQYLPFYNEPTVYYYLAKTLTVTEKYLSIFKYHGYSSYFYKGIGNIFSTYSADTLINGFTPLPLQAKSFDWENNNSDFSLSENNLTAGLNYIEKVYDQCQLYGSQLILVYSPQYYTSNYSIFMDSVINFIESKQITLLDYRHSPICKDKNLFYDSEHLNYKGADNFSQLFADDFNKLVQKTK